MQLLTGTTRALVLLLWLVLLGGSVRAQVASETAIAPLLEQAQASLQRSDWATATRLLTQVLAVQEQQRGARKTLIQALLQQNQFAEAERHAQILALQTPGDAETFSLRAAIALQQGNFAQASEWAAQCVKLHPRDAAGHKLLALSAYLQRQFAPFEHHIRTAARLNPLDPEPHYHLGRYYFEEKRYEEALQAFQIVFQRDADYYKARYYAALVYKGQNEMELSKRELQTAIRIIEQRKLAYAWPYADLGWLFINEGEYERGVGWLYRGVRNDPASPYAHYHYAKALFQKDASFEVKAELDAALKLDPGYADAWYLLARYYKKAGQEQLAQETFTKFEEIKKNPLPSPFGVRRW
jgi:Tfp pilus assembly protein PilF